MSSPAQKGEDAEMACRWPRWAVRAAWIGRIFRAVFDADVHVDAVQEHLVTPVGGALHQLCVALGIGDALAAGACEGVRAGGGQVDAQVRGQGRQVVDAVRQVGHALGDGRARLGDDLNRVEEHLAVDARVGACRQSWRGR